MPDLIEQLRQAPQTFNLFQALSILERSEPARAAPQSRHHPRIKGPRIKGKIRP